MVYEAENILSQGLWGSIEFRGDLVAIFIKFKIKYNFTLYSYIYKLKYIDCIILQTIFIITQILLRRNLLCNLHDEVISSQII